MAKSTTSPSPRLNRRAALVAGAAIAAMPLAGRTTTTRPTPMLVAPEVEAPIEQHVSDWIDGRGVEQAARTLLGLFVNMGMPRASLTEVGSLFAENFAFHPAMATELRRLGQELAAG